MYENPFDRKFGIEFEFSFQAIPVKRDPTTGRVENRERALERFLIENGLDWHVHMDGSEWEVRTEILQGPTGFKKVKRFLDLLNKHGARVSLNADGLHVHHDAPEFYYENDGDPYYRKVPKQVPVTRLVENWYKSQNEIYKMVNSCRVGRYACPEWAASDVELIRTQFDRYAPSMGRKNLNISSLRKHGTIEIRLHEGTLNYEEVLSWVRFGQAFIGKAVEDTESYEIDSVDSPYDLMRKIKVSRNASRFLSRKVEMGGNTVRTL